MGDLAAFALLFGPVIVAVGLGAALQRWAYRKVSDGRSPEDDAIDAVLEAAPLELGLARVGASSRFPLNLGEFEGERDGFLVRVEESGELGRSVTITVAALDEGGRAVPFPIGIAPRGPDGAGGRGAADIGRTATGDPEFDRRVSLDGDPALICATMDQVTRWGVQESVAHPGGERSLRTEGGRLVLHSRVPPHDAGRIRVEIDRLLELARRLVVPPEEVEARLARNARQDEALSVRLRVVDVLAGRAARHPGSKATLRSLLGDADHGIRLEAAAGLGEEGLPVIEDLVFQPGPDERIAVRALGHLARIAPSTRARTVLRAAFKGPDGPRRIEALVQLHRLGLADERDALPLLQSDVFELRRAGVALLGTIGTAAAVAPLRALIDENILAGELRAAARGAIAQIQARLTGAAPGQVALSPEDGAAGRVALAGEERAGRISLSPPDRDKVSIPTRNGLANGHD